MNLDNLSIEDLPDAEKEFIAILLQSRSITYDAGYTFEAAMQLSARNYFANLDSVPNISLARIGSGGRYEGAGVGEQELLLVTRDSAGPADFSEELLQGTIRLIEGNIAPEAVFGRWVRTLSAERKRIEEPERLPFFSDNPTPYPARVLEAEWIAGNPDLLFQAKHLTLQQIKLNRSIIDGVAEDKRRYRRVCESGLSRFKGKEYVQFEAATHTVVYDPQNQQYGFKYAFLRFIQTALALDIYRFMVARDIDPQELVDLNPSVEERIRYILRKCWVRRTDDLIRIGRAYVRACALQTELKVAYHFNDVRPATTKLKPSSIPELQHVATLMQIPFLEY